MEKWCSPLTIALLTEVCDDVSTRTLVVPVSGLYQSVSVLLRTTTFVCRHIYVGEKLQLKSGHVLHLG